MNKTSTNGKGSGGDERNMYIRRYKPTNNSSKASSNASLTRTMSEPESVIRSKCSENIVRYSSTARNNTKSKPRIPVKIGLGQAPHRINRSHIVNINKEVKNTTEVLKNQDLMTKMKQESANLERKQKSLNVQIENKEATEQLEINKPVIESIQTNDQTSDHQENGNPNGLDKKEILLDEVANELKKNGEAEQNGELPVTNEKEEDFDLQLDPEENVIKSKGEIPNTSKDILEVNIEDNIQNEIKTLVEEVQEQLLTGSQSCSVDVVESTTSEVSESSEPTSPLEIKNKDNFSQDENNDAISYDSSIMLKDVKIKLNDCLKDGKVGEENNADQGLPMYVHKENTFGKTLRTISGRSSIDRMRHVTVRDRQPSPNSSLFVNTSNTSFSEDSITDYKILHHRNTVSELTSSNSSLSLDRKRKLISESSSDLKKPKIGTSGLWSASLELLKYPLGLQRPTQLSTPYKFHTDINKLNASKESNTEDSGIIKKWCVIM